MYGFVNISPLTHCITGRVYSASAAIGCNINGDGRKSTSFPSTQYYSLLHFPAAGFVPRLPENRAQSKHS